MSPKALPAMCRVRIGFQNFLMPADKGLKVVALLQGAVACEEQYSDRQMQYVIDGPATVDYTSVQHAQIVQPAGAEPMPTRGRRALPLHQPQLGFERRK